MGHLHCSSSSSAVVGTATASAGPEKHPWLSLAALLAADAAVALAITVAATLGLCSGCLLCLLPMLLLLLAMTEVTVLSPQGLRTKLPPVHQGIQFVALGAFNTFAQLKVAHMCKRSQARIVQLPDNKPYSQCAIFLRTAFGISVQLPAAWLQDCTETKPLLKITGRAGFKAKTLACPACRPTSTWNCPDA